MSNNNDGTNVVNSPTPEPHITFNVDQAVTVAALIQTAKLQGGQVDAFNSVKQPLRKFLAEQGINI